MYPVLVGVVWLVGQDLMTFTTQFRLEMLKSNFLDNRLPKRKTGFYSIIVFLIALYVMLLKEPRPTQRLVLACYDDYAAITHRDTNWIKVFIQKCQTVSMVWTEMCTMLASESTGGSAKSIL